MASYLDGIKKNLGFGCMRLPMKDSKIDYDEFSAMVDEYLKRGFNYFDTAHGYHGGQSEIAIRECLTKRHSRDEYILTDKLSNGFFNSEEEIRPFFESQLEACGVEYFDFYLMHAQNANYFEKYKKCRAYETALDLKAEGKIKHFGLSFHDKASVLDQILTEYPQVEVVQIQFNYADYDDPGVQSRECYEVCRKHGKGIIVMEPVKGGALANLPPKAMDIVKELNGGSAASYAIRYTAGFDGVFMVLSGMSNMQQLIDNTGFMSDFKPLDMAELYAVKKIKEVFASADMIPCTACRYCTEECPKNIAIPDIISCINSYKRYHSWISEWYYSIYTKNAGKASDCIKCGKCEKICPQHLHVRDILQDIAKQFEGKEK